MNIQWQAKRRLVIAAFIILTAGIVWIIRLDSRGAQPSTNGATAAIPPKAERRKMQWADQIQLLERHGQVPEDADVGDWQYAEHTSWWGKRLEAKEFWKDRVVWLDESAREAAKRKGRGCPPMPYDDPRFAQYENDKDIDNSMMWNVEGPNTRFKGTERESAFWSEFGKTHPHPPVDLAREQYMVADSILGARHLYNKRGNPARTTVERLAQGDVWKKQRAQELGTPEESLGEDALFWSYVFRKREEYETKIAPLAGANSRVVTNWVGRLFVEPKYVTEPLTSVQLKAANAWKFAYLQRLRREKTDESYINAYLKAWNLSREEVFGESQR